MTNILKGGYLAGKKTYVTAVVAIVGAIGFYLTGEADLVTTFQTIVAASTAAFIRSGISNGK